MWRSRKPLRVTPPGVRIPPSPLKSVDFVQKPVKRRVFGLFAFRMGTLFHAFYRFASELFVESGFSEMNSLEKCVKMAGDIVLARSGKQM
jgi:hypothetical protein